MKIKAETRIEINVRDREMYVNYGTYETESEYHGLEDYLRINLNLCLSQDLGTGCLKLAELYLLCKIFVCPNF